MNSIFSPKLFETDAAGEDLEYTSAFSEFTAQASFREERQVGNHIIPAQPPDWNEVFKRGCALLERSHDLRVLAAVCRAALQQYGLPGLSQGLALMAHWIEQRWDDLYPALEIDGEYDPLLRSNAVSELSDPEGLVRALRQAVFMNTSLGTITVFVAENLINGRAVGEKAVVSSIEQLSIVLLEEQDKNQEYFVALTSIHSSLTTISSVFREKLKSEYWPDIELLSDIVRRLNHFRSENLSNPQEAVQTGQMPDTDFSPDPIPIPPASSASVAPTEVLSAISAINTRKEAFKALALARKYFEVNEPSHPAPLLIKRIERLSELDFLSIIEDLAPDGLQQLRMLTGGKE